MVSYSIDPKEYYILTFLEEIPILSIDPENHNVFFFRRNAAFKLPEKWQGPYSVEGVWLQQSKMEKQLELQIKFPN